MGQRSLQVTDVSAQAVLYGWLANPAKGDNRGVRTGAQSKLSEAHHRGHHGLIATDLEAQVGLSSEVSQVALTARVAQRISMQRAGAIRETGSDSTQMSVRVRVSANTGYRLVVVRTVGAPGERLWVRDAAGDFRELTSGGAVTVARAHRAGEWEKEVRYRAEGIKPAEGRRVLPVRYEIRVEPTI